MNEIGRRCETLGWLFHHHTFDERCDFRGHLRPEGANRRRLLGLMPHQFLRDRPVRERGRTREQKIKRSAQTVNIRADIDAVLAQYAVPRTDYGQGDAK